MKRKILHLLTWNINDIISNLDKIKNSGFTHIQISPIQKCKEGNEWWKAYQPYSFEIGNKYGNKKEFIELCNKAHDIGLQIVVDVILRHLAGDETDFLSPHKNCDSDIISNKNFWTDSIDCDDYNDRWKETHRCTGLPMLDYDNIELQNKYFIPFLDEVLKYADGLRIDQLKHYTLPSEGGTFCTNILKRYKDKFIYGECINLPSNKLKEYSEYCFPLIAGYEKFDSNHCVRFFESADTFKSFLYTVGMTDNIRINNWKELLKQYDNCVLFARDWDNVIFSNEIREINNKYI